MDIRQSLRRLIDVLPLHAEEGPVREVVEESQLLRALQTDLDETASAAVLQLVRVALDVIAVMDRKLLATSQWAFVSFPASLAARSLLETISTPGQALVEPYYWEQGAHRPHAVAEEQRALLHGVEGRRQRFSSDGTARAIRTVHVAWGVIKINARFLMLRRDDKIRARVGNFVFPGGRLNLADLGSDGENPASLRDLFQMDSDLARVGLGRTLHRELEEECGILPDQYTAHAPRILPAFQKVEGAGNLHGLSQYHIALFPIKLKPEAELELLRKEALAPDRMAWFTSGELLDGTRSDGKQAFVDAIKAAHESESMQFLDDLPDSAALPLDHAKETDALDLPWAMGAPLLVGKTGKESEKSVPLDRAEWGMLLLLGWHARELKVEVIPEHLQTLANGWVHLLSEDSKETAERLIAKLSRLGIPGPQLRSRSYCRLTIAPQYIYFGRELFQYFLPEGDEDQRITFALTGVDTPWGHLGGEQLGLDLSRNMVRLVRTIADGGDTDSPQIKGEDLTRQVRDVFSGIRKIGLRKFVYISQGQFRVSVTRSSVELR